MARILVFFLLYAPFANAVEKLTIAVCQWAPYTGDVNGNPGVLTEVTQEILHRMGYETQVVILPWARAMQSAISGESHVLVGASYAEDRLEQFSGKTVGILNGSFLESKLKQNARINSSAGIF